LRLTWFSYAEDKFYKGDFLLPQERIYQLLKQGSWDIEKNKHVTFTTLTVCVLPKGVVVVWLTGGNQVLIGRYQGQEFSASAAEYKHYYGPADRALMVRNTQAELPAEVQAHIKAGTLSTKQWDEWLKTYPWKVEFAQPLTLYRYAAYYTSAERTRNPLTREGLDAYRAIVLEPSAKPLPTNLHFYGQAAAQGPLPGAGQTVRPSRATRRRGAVAQAGPHQPADLLLRHRQALPEGLAFAQEPVEGDSPDQGDR
jgi:hypothetical protein